ncbi:MAG: hypothetical protein HOP16_00590 [Acidobacteria bacterium]|nr:hypothetical protein [Acidobacteriota bacterium]
MARARRYADESGVALITALLIVMLMSALMVGMFAALSTDLRSQVLARDQTTAYAAAHAGIEKATAGLAALFAQDFSPSAAQVTAIVATPPTIPGSTFTTPGGAEGSGYAISFTPDADGNPASQTKTITSGPFEGFQGLVTPYVVTSTAASDSLGTEVRLRREFQTVAVPVFQFGVFSETDLTFYAGDDFDFGGRVHTNGSLFVCEFAGTMTFSDRITAFGDVVHNFFSNGLAAASNGCNGDVNILTAPGTPRNLRQSPNEGSVTGMPGSAANGLWPGVVTTYNGYLRNGTTGARRLDLPLVSQGAEPFDLIRRPALGSNEHTSNAPVFGQRYFAQASLRILLSDRVADFTTLPTVTASAPVLLDGAWNTAPPAGYGPVDATHPPIARSIGPGSTQTVAGSTHAGSLSQIRVTDTAAGIPAVYKLPPLIVRKAGFADVPVTCTGKTATQFTGCTGNLARALPITVVATLPSGGTVTKNVTVATTAGGATITVAANDTAPYSPNLIWINKSGATVANTAVPVTCIGYTDVSPRRFIDCTGLTAAPASGLVITTSALANQNTGTIGGYIKIEKQSSSGVWTDVTMEILNLGIGAPNQGGTLCADPNTTAVIRIQRLRDNGGTACTYAASTNAWDWWPNTLYDTREGNFRDIATTSPMMLGGVMQYISLDVGNLKRWFSGAIGTTGTAAWNNNGYIVYFSDRRGDHNEGATTANIETAEYGFEDRVNPTTAAGTPDNVLQTGEDMNGNGTQQLYGRTPWNDAANIPAGAAAPYSTAGTPHTVIPIGNSGTGAAPVVGAGMARVNKVVLFRRALKLVNGGISGGVNNLPTAGLTVAAENPVYVQGNYNATTSPTAEPNVPAAVIADAVTVLSNNWKDSLSFEVPNARSERDATVTGYRFGVVAGKGLSFNHCGATCGSPGFLFGTDGGVGNFLRLLENWNIGGVSINYRGSVVSLHISRQAIGPFKYNTNVYDFGDRNFTFDTDFLTPTLLPPGTPMFRDINTLTFRQILRPDE